MESLRRAFAAQVVEPLREWLIRRAAPRGVDHRRTARNGGDT
jgi:hypothetical protein